MLLKSFILVTVCNVEVENVSVAFHFIQKQALGFSDVFWKTIILKTYEVSDAGVTKTRRFVHSYSMKKLWKFSLNTL